MSLSLFSTKNAWYKNGTLFPFVLGLILLGMFWWSKILNKAVGEQRYDVIRLQRRVWSLKFYYNRQQALYEYYSIPHFEPDLTCRLDSSLIILNGLPWLVFTPKPILLTVSPTLTTTKCTEISKKTPSTPM